MTSSPPSPTIRSFPRIGLALATVLLLVATGCNFRTRPIPGDAPLRYRDLVFSNVTTTSNLTYGSAVNQSGATVTLRLDLYEPTGDTVEHRPAIVWVHGGSFAFGSKTSPELVDQATVFARKGYVNVSIDYRLSATGCTVQNAVCVQSIIDAQHDAQAAVRWLRANADTYGIDTERISIAGTSAGAITALNVAFSPNEVGTSGNPGFPSHVDAAVSLSGAAFRSADPGDAPVLLFHGTNDSLVPYSWATDTIAGAEADGINAELTTWEGAGHVPYAAHRTEIIDQTTNFLYWSMGLTLAEQ
jgi:acetyl esterase/lipase